jgi:hypothetical protein
VAKPAKRSSRLDSAEIESSRRTSGRSGVTPPAEDGPASAAALSEPAAATPGARSLLELVALFVAPTTLVTALAYYFGWTLTNARSLYFGIDPSTLGFTTQDYLLRSTDALFLPLAAAVGLAVAALVVHSLVVPRLRAQGLETPLRRAAWTAGAVGAALLALGIAAALEPLPFETYYLLPPLSGGLGAILLAYAVSLVRGRLSPVGLALVSSAVVLSAFWATSVYADALGRGRAQDLESALERQPHVVVYVKQSLNIDVEGVEQTALEEPGSAYAFRYAGLRLLVRSGGQYFLLPSGWSHDDGDPAIVLRDTNDLRFEFSPIPSKDTHE